MKSKTALVLAVLLAACLVFIAVRKLDLFGPRAPSTGPAPKELVFEKEPMGIVHVVVSPADGTKLVLAKRDGEWRIEEPLRARADTYKVHGLLDAVGKFRTGRSFLPGDKDVVQPAITSLDRPLWTVELADANGARWLLEVGKPVPLRPSETYVRSAGSPRVHVALADMAQTLRKPPRDYRSETVLQFNTSQVVALTVSGREVRGAYELHKQKDEWGIVKPFSARADRDAVQGILGDLSYLRVANFVTDEPSSLAGYGLEEGKERLLVQVTVQTEPNAPRPTPETSSMPDTAPASGPAPKVHAVAFGGRTDDNKVFARVPGEPAVFHLNASTLDGLLKKLEGIRQNTVLEFDSETVSAVELNLPDGNTSLLKQDGRWTMVQPIAGKAGARAIWDLLGRLSALKAQSWADPRTAPAAITGLDKPYGRITVTLAGLGQTATLLIGKSLPSEETYVKAESATSIALVKTSDTIALLAPGATYWDPSLFSLPYDLKATRLAVARRDGNFSLIRQEDSWGLAEPIQAPADGPQVERILKDLAHVTADKVVHLGPEVPEKYAKAVHNLTVEVHGRRPAATQPASAPATEPATSSAPASAPLETPTTAATQPAAADDEPTTATSEPATRPATMPSLGPEALAGRLQVVKVDDKSYAWVPGAETIAIGELPAGLYDDLAAELRERTVWKVEPNEVIGIRLLAGGERLELRREGEEWVNALNPDEKADTEKVRTYLSDLKDLSAERFITYRTTPEDANKLGVSQPWATLELRLAGGKAVTLAVSARGPDLAANRYAVGGTAEGIFVVSSEIIGKLAKKFADLRKSSPKPPE